MVSDRRTGKRQQPIHTSPIIIGRSLITNTQQTIVGIVLLLAEDLFVWVAVSNWSIGVVGSEWSHDQENIYERLENDTAIAGTLAIWEVKTNESDTPVWQHCAIKDTAAVMAALPTSDSVVYCWGKASPGQPRTGK